MARASILAAALLAASGCGDPDAGLSACDIRTASCQYDVFLAVQRVRGHLWDPWTDTPPMRTITAEQYRQELLAARAPEDDGSEPEFDHFEAALELLGLLDPERAPSAAVEARVSGIAAYYAPRDRAITILDHGEPGDLERGTALLAHELVHAAQDRELGLALFSPGRTRDESYVRQSFIEGEARLFEALVTLEARGQDIGETDWKGYGDAMLQGSLQAIYDAESPYYQLFTMVYPLGYRYLVSRYLTGGYSSVRDAFEAPTRTVLGLFEGGAVEAQPPVLACISPEPPAGYVRAGGTAFGLIPLYGVLTRFAPDADTAFRWARAWRGDRFTFYSEADADADTDDGRTLVVWQLRFVEDGRFQEILAGMLAWYGGSAVSVEGDEIYLRLASHGPPADWDGWQRCHPP